MLPYTPAADHDGPGSSPLGGFLAFCRRLPIRRRTAVAEHGPARLDHCAEDAMRHWMAWLRPVIVESDTAFISDLRPPGLLHAIDAAAVWLALAKRLPAPLLAAPPTAAVGSGAEEHAADKAPTWDEDWAEALRRAFAGDRGRRDAIALQPGDAARRDQPDPRCGKEDRGAAAWRRRSAHAGRHAADRARMARRAAVAGSSLVGRRAGIPGAGASIQPDRSGGSAAARPASRLRHHALGRDPAQGLSQEELAFRAGMSVPYLSDLERGRSSPSLAMVVDLARGLETHPSLMLSDLIIDSVGEPPRRKRPKD